MFLCLRIIKANFAFSLRLNRNVGFFATTFSRHDRIDAGIILPIWLSEKVGFFATTFSRHGRLDASIILLIWLSEKVRKLQCSKLVV